jgi:hypothetical protein
MEGKSREGPVKKRQKCEPALVDQRSAGFVQNAIEEMKEANPHMTVILDDISKWRTMLKTMVDAESTTIYFQFGKEGVTVIASGTLSKTCVAHWNKDMFHVYELAEEFAFTVMRADLAGFRKTLPPNGELIIGTRARGDMYDDQGLFFVNMIISKSKPDAPASIMTKKIDVGNADDFAIPPNVNVYQEPRLEVLVSSDLFHENIGRLCGGTLDFIQIQIKNNVMAFSVYQNSRLDASTKWEHPVTAPGVEYLGKFNPKNIKEAAKKELNTHVHLKWVMVEATESSVLILTYPLSPFENGPTGSQPSNSHLSFYLAEVNVNT